MSVPAEKPQRRATYEDYAAVPERLVVYARERVKYVWLVHPIRQTLEAFTLNPDGYWLTTGLHEGNQRVRVPPFDAIELDLGLLWPEVEDAKGAE